MKIIKFDLPIDGMKVRNLEELRDHFTPEILELYRTGLLTKWLASRQLSQELSAIKAIEVQEDQALLKRLCEIFDIQADEDFILAACATAAIIPVPAPAKTADETVPPAKVKPAAYLIQMPSQETINEVVEEAAYCLAEKLDFATGFEVDVDISTPKPDAPVSKTTEIKAKTLKEIFSNNEEKINSRRVSGLKYTGGAFCGWELNKKEIKRKISNAISSYAKTSADKVIVIVDGTIFGSADEGIIITENEIFIKIMWEETFAVEISKIEKIAHDIKEPAIIINDSSVRYIHSELSGSIDVIVNCLDEYITQRQSRS